MMAQSILIVSDDLLARAGLALLLQEASDYTLRQADSSVWEDESLAADADVIICDLGWEGWADLPEWRELNLPVVALVADEEGARAAWTAGARAVVGRGDSPDSDYGALLSAAVEAVHQGLVAVHPEWTPALLPIPDAGGDTYLSPDLLTEREVEVLERLAEGDTNKAIAQSLGITDHTVKYHINALMTKLGAQSRTDAVVRALRAGALSL